MSEHTVVGSNTHICEVKGLSKSFGGLQALDDVDLRVPKGKLVSLIGPNGAGKTTLFNCLTGFTKPSQGEVIFYGRNLVGLPAHKISRLGMKRTFQNVQVFPSLSVTENVLVGFDRALKSNVFLDAVRAPRAVGGEKKAKATVVETLEFLGIAEYREMPAGSLPYGIQKKVELARALVSRPLLLLADEPVCGLSLAEQQDMSERFKRIRDTLGVTILLIEHNMEFVMPLSDEVSVLNFGRLIATGSPKEVSENHEVRKAYLGTD